MTKNDTELTLSAVLRTDFMSFAEKCFYTLYPGKIFFPNWHHDAIAAVLLGMQDGTYHSKVAINAPPRHFKSELISVIYPAWLFAHDPGLKILSLSYSDILVRKHMRQMRQIMESDWYRLTFPKTKISSSKNSETLIELVGGGQRYAQPLGGQITGQGGDYVLIDDPHKVGPMLTTDSVAKDVAWFRETLTSRLEQASKARVIIVMQRVRPNDLTGFAIGHFNYKQLKIEAIATKDSTFALLDGRTHSRKTGDVLQPEYTSKEDLDVLKDTMGPRLFEGQFQQNPQLDGGALILPEYFGRSDRVLQYHNYDAIIQSWDTASSASASAAYSVCLTFGLRKDKYHLLNIFRKQLEYLNLVKAAHKQIDLFGPSHVFIEHASTGVSLYSELRDAYGVGVYNWTPSINKVARIEAVLSILSKQSVVLVEGVSGLDAFEQEIYSFTGGENETSDQVDALTLLMMGLKLHNGRLPGPRIYYPQRRPSLTGFPQK